jgi:hypothetical protein
MEDLNEAAINENSGDLPLEKPQNEHHKPFLSKMVSKQTPIGYDFHQVYVEDTPPFTLPLPCSLYIILEKTHLPPYIFKASFLRSRINEEELDEYLAFIESFYEDKIPDYFAQGNHYPKR